MNNSAVIFGPVNAGKSTLIGYLFVKLNIKYDFKKDLKKWRAEQWFKEEQKIAYIADKSIKERIGEREGKLLGVANSRHYHILTINDYEAKTNITLVDTPGHPNLFRGETIRPFSGSDVGIFLIEVSSIFKLINGKNPSLFFNFLNHTLLPLKFWISLGHSQNTIIAFSKMDEVEFSNETYNICKKYLINTLRELSVCFDKISIIPIFIDVKNETDDGVYSQFNKMKWFDGKTICAEVKDKFKDNSHEERNGLKFFNINKDKISLDGNPNIIRGCLLQGRINFSDKVKIFPVEVNKKIATISAFIMSIKPEHAEIVDTINEGNFAGLSLRDIKDFNTGRRVDKFSLLKTSVVTNVDLTFSSGNIIEFKINEILDLKFFESIEIYWFGKLIQAKVLKISERYFLTIVSNIFSIPVRPDDSLVYSKFIIMDNKNNCVIPVEINRLGFAKKIALNIKKTDPNINFSKIQNIISHKFNNKYKICDKVDLISIEPTEKQLSYKEHILMVEQFGALKKKLNKENIDFNIDIDFDSSTYNVLYEDIF